MMSPKHSVKPILRKCFKFLNNIYYRIKWIHLFEHNIIVFKETPKQTQLRIDGSENSIDFNCVLSKCVIDIRGNNNSIFFLDNAVLKNIEIKCYGHNNLITIERNNKIGRAFINIVGSDHRLSVGQYCSVGSGDFWLYGNGCEIVLDEMITVEQGHFAATEENTSIQIGKECMISTEVEIRTGDSHAIRDINTDQRLNMPKNIIIEEHVWIGARASILKGVRIRRNSIVGTGAIVTHEVPENVIVAGVPAKIIKKNVTWSR